MNSITADPALLRRYDRPAPRYTSYPAATQFGSEFTANDLREQIARSNEVAPRRNLSLYVHVPFCSNPCYYCGCNRIITRDAEKGRRYVQRLLREGDMFGEFFPRDREVMQLHFGGGTPNFLAAKDLGAIIDGLSNRFAYSASERRDFSIELDPRSVSDADVADYASMGLNRASLGVQDFDPAVQEAVNRVQTPRQTIAVIEACRAHRFRSINIDLIYGLPRQTLAGFSRTLDTVLGVRPERLAIYSYAHLPHLFKPQRQIYAPDLPSPELKLELLQLAIEKLSDAGYQHIGMDHFAIPEDDLSQAQAAHSLQRNFMGYSTHASCDLLGLGVSSISHIGNSFSQNPRELPQWEKLIDAGRLPVWRGRVLDNDDLLRGAVIQELMCHGDVDMAEFERYYGVDFRSYFAAALAELQPLAADELVELDGPHIRVTSRGRLLLRIIATCFDRYLQTTAATAQPRHSRAI